MGESYFKTRFQENNTRETVWKCIVNWLNNTFISPKSIILDVGAGYCNFINNIKCKEKHALDHAKIIRKYAKNDVFIHIQKSANIGSLKTNYFNVVFASNFFEHLDDMQLKKTFAVIRRVLKRKGILIILQPNFRYCYKNYFDDFTHKKVFSDESMNDFLISEGFRIICRKNRFLPFSLKSSPVKSKFLINLYLNSPIKPFAKQMLFVAKKEE